MSTVTLLDSNHLAHRDSLALIITNAYRARHGMPPVTHHASVDEDIAEAILHAGWTAPETSPEKKNDELAFLNESISNGVGSVNSARARHVRNIALKVMEAHGDFTDRNDGHKLLCQVDSVPWPCPEYETARTAYIKAGGDPEEV